jgi:hypothetical protein
MSVTQKKLAKKIVIKKVAVKGTPKKNIGGACDCA